LQIPQYELQFRRKGFLKGKGGGRKDFFATTLKGRDAIDPSAENRPQQEWAKGKGKKNISSVFPF